MRSPGWTADDVAVARLIVGGVPVTQIARRLHMSRRTTYRRIGRLKELVGATDRADLTARLREHGFTNDKKGAHP